MKKIGLLLNSLLLSAVAMATDYTGIQLTFKRTGTAVEVTVKDWEGKAIQGVRASLERTSFGTLMSSGADAITNGSVLAPAGNSSYGNAADSEITYTFKVEGLDDSYAFDKADIDVYAMNKNGGAQGNGGDTKRYFHFFVKTGADGTNFANFASHAFNTDICTVPSKDGGLYHSVQHLSSGTLPQPPSSSYYIQVTLKKKSSEGCYAGIGSVRLYSGNEKKFYTIRRFTTLNSYIYQDGSTMSTGTLSNENMSWWMFESTGTPNRYYIKNAATGQYIQTSYNIAQNDAVSMGDTPVEFEVKKDFNNGKNTNGYYYIASTDQTISTESSSNTKGLNWSSSLNKVVTWYIRSGTNGNSYWEIIRDLNRYSPTEAIGRTQDQLQMYSIPCGEKGNAYISAADFVGEDVLKELHFCARAMPVRHDSLYTHQKADVKQGGTLPVNITIANSNSNSNVRAFAYTDWDKDGVFDDRQEFSGNAVSLLVPADAEIGQYRVRIRVIEGEADAENQAKGFSYDFLINVVDANTEIEWSVEVSSPSRGVATGSVVEEGGEKKLIATVKTIGDAEFKGWKLMHNYYQGEMLSSEAELSADDNYEIQLPLTQSIRLVAVIEPNTKVTETVTAATYSTMYYSNVALRVPENVQAKTYKVADGTLSVSQTYEPGDIIPAGEPVALYDNKQEANTYDFFIATTTNTPDPDNMLLGFDEAKTTVGPNGETTGYVFYKFSFKGRDANGHPANVGFYHGATGGKAFTSAAHKAYLAVPQGAMGSEAKSFFSMPDNGGTTDIDSIDITDADGSVYSLQGIKIMTASEFANNRTKLPKGVYIINQKKKIIK